MDLTYITKRKVTKVKLKRGDIFYDMSGHDDHLDRENIILQTEDQWTNGNAKDDPGGVEAYYILSGLTKIEHNQAKWKVHECLRLGIYQLKLNERQKGPKKISKEQREFCLDWWERKHLAWKFK